ncbi:MAG: histidine phosphatase family protein [Nocardioides sp.]
MAEEVWLVRHGATEWSKAGRHTSTTDLPLLPEGEDAARGLRSRLDPAAYSLVLMSPRRRARETAALAGFAAAEVDDDLAEWAYGDYEGITSAEIRERDPGWTIWDGEAPGGETPAEVAARVDRVIERADATGGRVLLFAHGHVLRALAARWLGESASGGRHYRLDTATVSVLGYEHAERVLLRWNA